MSQLHIIWDLDGTLIDSEAEVLKALELSVREAGLSENDQRAAFRMGPPIDIILEAAFAPEVLTEEKKKRIVASFRTNYDNCGFNNTLPFDGINEILSSEGLVHHIVTNKPDLATARILERLGWKEKFLSVITPYSFMRNPGDKRKSKAELFSICMTPYKGSRFVGIGDMEGDACAAKAAGITALGVLWGTGTSEELQICDAVFSDTQKLHEYLKTQY